MVIDLQEVLSRNLQFHNGTYSELPDSIKFILNNLQTAFTRNHRNLFQKTLRALEIHLVNLTAQNEAYISHYGNLASEYANIVSENEAYRSHLVNQPNITDEPYDPYTSQLVLLPTCLQTYYSLFWKARLCLRPLTYGPNISKNL